MATFSTYQVKENQSIIDLGTQIYGTPDGAVLLADDNGLGLTTDLAAGQVLKIQPDQVINDGLVEYFSLRNIELSTGPAELTEIVEGFDYRFNFELS